MTFQSLHFGGQVTVHVVGNSEVLGVFALRSDEVCPIARMEWVKRGLDVFEGGQRELPSLETAAKAVVPVTVLELNEMTFDSTDSAPPIEPPVKEGGAEADAAELPRESVQFSPFNST